MSQIIIEQWPDTQFDYGQFLRGEDPEYIYLRPAPGLSFPPGVIVHSNVAFDYRMQPTRMALALLGVYAWHLTHRMQPDVLDEALVRFVEHESAADAWDRIKHSLAMKSPGKTYRIRWSPPLEIKLSDWTLRAARIALAMNRMK